MQIIKSTLDYNNFYKNKIKDKTIGFVPTMGYLHAGHISLINESINNNQITIVSIFVNPTQFGKGEDYTSYPRSEKEDIILLEKIGVDVLFVPTVDDIYPHNFTPLIKLEINAGFTNKLCGKYRPGHFNGVGTVVMKLLSIIKADNAYFGLKDYQQYLLIKNLANTFYPIVNIIGIQTIREISGLALSSRNSYLTDEEKQIAASIYANLIIISNKVKEALNIYTEKLSNQFELSLIKVSDKLKLQYFEIYDTDFNIITTYIPRKTFI